MACGCAPNPNGVKSGQWVKHQVTDEEYFLTEWYSDTGDVTIMKDRQGHLVQEKINIIELAPLEEAGAINFTPLIAELKRAHIALDEANTPTARAMTEEAIKEGEAVMNELSPVFRERKWNHSTQSYE